VAEHSVFKVAIEADVGYLVFVESELVVAEQFHLAVDEQGGDDEEAGGDELEDDEAFAQDGGGGGWCLYCFQGGGWIEAGDEEGWEEPGQQTCGADEGDDQEEVDRLKNIGERNLPAGEIVIKGEGYLEKQYGDPACEGSQEQRFAQEMQDELAAWRAEDFTYGHFFLSFQGLGGKEVDEVDAGDDANEDSNGGEDVDIQDTAVRSHLLDKIGVKVNIGEGLEAGAGGIFFGVVFFHVAAVVEPKVVKAGADLRDVFGVV